MLQLIVESWHSHNTARPRGNPGKLPQFMAEMPDDASDFSSVAFSESKSGLKRWFGLSTLRCSSLKPSGPVHQMAALRAALCGSQLRLWCPVFVLHDHEKTEVVGARRDERGVGGGVLLVVLVDPDDGRRAPAPFRRGVASIAKVPAPPLGLGRRGLFCSSFEAMMWAAMAARLAGLGMSGADDACSDRWA